MNSQPSADSPKCPFGASIVTLDRMNDLKTVLRSKSAIESPYVSTDNYLQPNDLGDINVKEFMSNIITMINGDDHRERRKLINSLVRPEELVRFREDIVLPAVDRWLTRAIQTNEDGTYGCDLAAVVERVFLEFAAKLIGLRGVESVEGMARLRSCVLPMFAGMSASHFEDREAVTQAGVDAKRVFVEEFYRPSLAAVRDDLAKVAAGDLPEGSVPLNLLYLIATGANEQYLDKETAIREAILFFVAATGTSAQAILSTVQDLSEWFAKHPEDFPLIDDLEFVSNALQESLRLKAPYVPYVTRLAVEDIDVPGCPIKAGDQIHAMVPAAGRDIEVFGPDAAEFNPKRAVQTGFNRYGFAFGSGAHQCMGLRVVLGNDGKSGSHLRMLQSLFKAGIKPDSSKAPEILAMRTAGDIPTYTTYPVIFTNWSKR